MADPILDVSLSELRSSRTSVKWSYFPEDVLPVWVAEMDARPCPPIVEAVETALGRGDTGYCWAPPYARAFAQFAERRWGWSPDPERMAVVADVMVGIEELIHALTQPGDAVIVSPPVYDSFFGFIESTRRRLVTAPLDAAGRLDMAALETAFRGVDRGAVYLLCSPSNPTGTVHTAAELAELAGRAERYGVQVIADEIHAPLTHRGVGFVPYLSIPEAAAGITVTSGSKAWNLAGLRAALAIPGSRAQRALGRVHEVVRHGANHLGVIAQTAAFRDGEAWLGQLTTELGRNRRLLVDLLAERLPGIIVRPAEATYLAWLDCRTLGLGDDPSRAFTARGRVALSSGPAYGEAGAGFARFNFATSPAVIREAVDRMARAIA